MNVADICKSIAYEKYKELKKHISKDGKTLTKPGTNKIKE